MKKTKVRIYFYRTNFGFGNFLGGGGRQGDFCSAGLSGSLWPGVLSGGDCPDILVRHTQ